MEQTTEFQPRFICNKRGGESGEVRSSEDVKHSFLSIEEIASHPDVDVIVIATSGKAGLSATIAAIKAGKIIALSNKEVLVMAGELITSMTEQYGAKILPVDSEHSAIWQCLKGEKREEVTGIILTASGGPFYHLTTEQMAMVTPDQALKHPTWSMGRKVTVDSATLMNKGMEVIEAHWLFDMPYESIKVVIQPQSVVHSMVEFRDGSVKAQLSLPDMRMPIQYAILYPDRVFNKEISRIDWDKAMTLDFKAPDFGRFPCLRIAIEAGKKGGTYPVVLCAADEIAVELFLAGRIGFWEIAKLVEDVISNHSSIVQPSLENILESDSWARKYAENWRNG
jgi:1-deoxy-D-xylulose-5-phosphate reductoisomerase